ncbi:helix-turn-helix transcriptional regulator [Kitasatospora sp. YST-16]|uniref:helix-turn-helix transcriptional regulator n=1 Tax=unclassified Kitasatospora TaxID=2633591 RepID=UPI0012FF562D|nr:MULTISPECIES: helix-turn-helix transcriptional regulator [unclassified Kitasatospora]WAL72459.1 helix-turn-helix transcriptional regulator [Kitasatospora sp. YST-16]WNW38510.1 helix-turn-helix transcriptional regulator [Streptomyces sp. Li-HN-5-13]
MSTGSAAHRTRPDVQAVLQAFGLSEAASLVYQALLRTPEPAEGALSAELGLSADEVHAAYRELTGLSLLRSSWDDPLTLRPVIPELGLKALLAHREAELLAHRQQVEQAQAAYEIIRTESASGRRFTHTEDLVGVDAIRDRLAELGARTRSQVLAFIPGGGQSESARRTSRPLDEELLHRGVELRTIFLDSVRNHQPTTDYARWLGERGGQVRTVPSLPMRMTIVDREAAVVPLDPERSDTATVLYGTGAVAAMCALFDLVWSGATPLGDARSRDPHGLSGQHYALLRILHQGETDVVAARKLGVSERTVRRLISELMDLLEARSRFQAGARAAERSWLR